MKFIVDMPLPPELAAWLSQLGHDAVHALEVGLAEASDTEIIAFAAQSGRTIITLDLDYPRLLAKAKATTPGLILFRHGTWAAGDIKAKLSGLMAGHSEAVIAESISTISQARTRVRPLPV